MTTTKIHWGFFICLCSTLFCGFAILILFNFFPPYYKSFYYKVVPYFGLMVSILAFFLGHFSYPRVHNLKVYLIGYLTGITGVFYFTIFNFPNRNDEAILLLFLITFLNIIVTLLIPSYVKYRVTQQITYSIVIFEFILMIFASINESLISWVNYIYRNDHFSNIVIISYLWLTIVIIISTIKLRNEFHLGGIICGFSLLIFLSWMAPISLKPEYTKEAEFLFFACAIVYLEIGIVIHWFSRMEHRISYDPLLQIYNRNFCTKIIEEQSNIKTTPPFGVAMVDLDHFKNVNDRYGHQAGDKVLYQVAQIILREIIPDGIACRYGGEEIIIFFPKKVSKDIIKIMEKVRCAIEDTKIMIKRKKLSVTVSCGISHRDNSSQKILDVIQAADKALYRAKKNGRNQVRIGKTLNHQTKKR